MGEPRPRAIFERFLYGLGHLDFEALREVLHPDFTEEYPQSGEGIRSLDALRKMLDRYPGGLLSGILDEGSGRMVGDEERWVLTPGFTVLPMAGGTAFTGIFRCRYPDGSIWHVVSIYEMRDGRIARATTYFAPEFPAPEWRADIVERVDRVEPRWVGAKRA
jgi:hypothetical protein